VRFDDVIDLRVLAAGQIDVELGALRAGAAINDSLSIWA
jgi:hypothetical protein